MSKFHPPLLHTYSTFVWRFFSAISSTWVISISREIAASANIMDAGLKECPQGGKRFMISHHLPYFKFNCIICHCITVVLNNHNAI